MFVPPYEALLNALRVRKSEIDDAKQITIPIGLLKLLLQLALTQTDFDEVAYLEANPDVRSAVNRGDIESGLLHYVGYGYFEGRSGGTGVDELWYLKEYPDVQQAIDGGLIKHAKDHFKSVGAGEGRSPNFDEIDCAAQWKKALSLT